MARSIGPGAVNGDATSSANTIIGLDNPATWTGYINLVQFYFNTNATGVKIGTFYGSGTSYTSRDVATIGAVTSGSVQTFDGLHIGVQSGDFLGIYFATGFLERTTTGGAGLRYKAGDQFGAGTQTYTALANNKPSIYGEGVGGGDFFAVMFRNWKLINGILRPSNYGGLSTEGMTI